MYVSDEGGVEPVDGDENIEGDMFIPDKFEAGEKMVWVKYSKSYYEATLVMVKGL